MNVLFAIKNQEKIIDNLVYKYQQDTNKKMNVKIVKSFTAIIRELQENKNYDRIIISENIINNELDILKKVISISQKAKNNTGNLIPIIFITSSNKDFKTLYESNVFNGLSKVDATKRNIYELIKKPRNRKEALEYYRNIGNMEKVNNKMKSEKSIENKMESNNNLNKIINYLNKIDLPDERYVKRFDKIYDELDKKQIAIIIKSLTTNTKKILRKGSQKYKDFIETQKKAKIEESQDTPKRGRGRPRKIKLEEEEEIAKERRGRGRPRKLEKDEKKDLESKPKNQTIKLEKNEKKIDKKIKEEKSKKHIENKIKEEKVNKKILNNEEKEEKEEKIKNVNKIQKKVKNTNNKNEAQKKNFENKIDFDENWDFEDLDENSNLQNITRKSSYEEEKNIFENQSKFNDFDEDDDLDFELESKELKQKEYKKDIKENKNDLNKEHKKNLDKEIDDDLDLEEDDDLDLENDDKDLDLEEDNDLDLEDDEDLELEKDDDLEDEDDLDLEEDEDDLDLEEDDDDLDLEEDEDDLDLEEDEDDLDLEEDEDDLDLEEDEDDLDLEEEDDDLDLEEDEDDLDLEEEDDDLDLEEDDDLDLEEDDDDLDLEEDDDDLDLEEEDDLDLEEDDDDLDLEEDDDDLDLEEEDDDLDLEEDEDDLDLEEENDDELEEEEDDDDELEEEDDLDLEEEDDDLNLEEDDDNEELNEKNEDFSVDDNDLIDFDDDKSTNEEDNDLLKVEDDDLGLSTQNVQFNGIKNKNYNPNYSISKQISEINGESNELNNESNSNIELKIKNNQRIAAFVGAHGNGTSFIINNIAHVLSEQGIKIAILDLTRNKNSYYIYTENEERLRSIAYSCFEKLKSGILDGIKINKNLDVFTTLPYSDNEIDDNESILKTLLKSYSLILIDCDFETNQNIFKLAQEIYLVQSLDVLTIQPLTSFLKKLKMNKGLDENKIRIIINKAVKVNSLNEKMLISAMSVYNSPDTTYQLDLFNRDRVQYIVMPFEEQNYSKYLEQLIKCKLTARVYSKGLKNSLNKLGKMIYPIDANKKI